ncbi:hypothetical protein AXX17_AT1G62360 [Arabidopsis thaliana]|jgi:hypothetical protein|uniref:Uncharacterized protein n=1 Tax=Arabidopsis thaliana TaxID=3702 RepID=A0A178WA65_ARATH|nr:hypothetical protein AXX17_AT1G62360 [Arabidopsis thaliana]
MVSGLINENPIIYPKKERRLRTDTSITDELTPEPIDQLEIFDILSSSSFLRTTLIANLNW